MIECGMGHAVLFSPTDRTEEHRCQRGACQSSARQMNTDSSQAECNLSVEIGEICGRRQPLHPTLSQDVLCNILVQKLCGDFR